MADIKFNTDDLKNILPMLAPKPPDVVPAPSGPPPGPPPPTPAQAGFNAWVADPQNQQKVSNAITPPGQPMIPPPPTFDQWQAAHPEQQEQPMWSGASKTSKVLDALAVGTRALAGNLPGAVGTAAQIYRHDQPGNMQQANFGRYQQQVIQPLQAQAALADTQSQTAQRTAAANKSNAQADAVGDPAALKAKQVQDAAKLGMTPQYDQQGNLQGYAEDPNSPISKQRAQKEELVSVQVENTKAQIELRKAQAAVENSKNDPNAPAYKLNLQKLAVARQNAAAASTRASAYMGKYLQGAYGVGMDGKTLPGSTVISDDAGNQTVVGSTNASQASKAQSQAAQFNDVHGSLDNIDNAARALVKGGGQLNSPGIAAALAHPQGELSQWLQGQAAKSSLTPAERDYVTALSAAHENIQALRKSAGGTATDSAVLKLDAMIPGASTPDLDYFLRQTGQIRQTATRLGQGAPSVTGGLTVRGKGKPQTSSAPPPADAVEYVRDASGKLVRKGK